MSSTHSHKRKNSHLFLQRKNSSSADMLSYEMLNTNTNGTGEGNENENEPAQYKNQKQSNYEPNYSHTGSHLVPNQPINWNFGQHLNRHKKYSVIIITIILLILILFLLPTGISKHDPQDKDNNIKPRRSFTIDDVLEGDFLYDDESFQFLRPPTDLLHYNEDPGLYISTQEIEDERRFVVKQLLDPLFVKDLGKTTLKYNDVIYHIKVARVDYQLKKMILGVNIKDEYRHSSKGLYFLKDLITDDITLIGPDPSVKQTEISFVHFSPEYNFIYFVCENNLYIQDVNSGEAPFQVTDDGSAYIFNGKPDWIYEEEILADEKAVWWAPDDSHLVYAKINDSEVGDHYIPKYTTHSLYAPMSDLKYPKPGTQNPKVSLHLLNIQKKTTYALEWKDESMTDYSMNPDDIILYDGIWVDSNNFLFKITDRTSKIMHVKLYQADSKSLSTTRITDATAYGGWIEKTKKILPIPPKEEFGRFSTGYLDVEADKDGFNHIFYYGSPNSTKGRQLTSGNWEIAGKGIIGFDQDSDTALYLANAMGSMSQHLYNVTLNQMLNTAPILSFKTKERNAFYDYELSPSSKFVVMSSLGPSIPFKAAGPMKMFHDLDSVNNQDIIFLSNNKTITESLTNYDLPKKIYGTIKIEDDVTINFVEIRPPILNYAKKYPVLVSVYGGPGSQAFSTKFSVFFEEAVSSGLDAIVLEIEPRGTGGKGWAFRKWANQKLGYWEPRDIVEVTEKYIAQNREIIDEKRIAIWGWSYGAFSSLKTVEYDAGRVFKYAMAVAPVTNWSYYDSFYTERYLGNPVTDPRPYRDISIIKSVKGFKKLERFLIMHGTADDNVHIENTYEFIDRLHLSDIDNYDMHIFPDSDHSIQFHHAQHIIFKKLFYWLKIAFTGSFDFNTE